MFEHIKTFYFQIYKRARAKKDRLGEFLAARRMSHYGNVMRDAGLETRLVIIGCPIESYRKYR